MWLVLRGNEEQFLFQDEFCVAMFLAKVTDFEAIYEVESQSGSAPAEEPTGGARTETAGVGVRVERE